MKNKLIKTLSVLFFASFCFVGCEDTDEFTGDSTLSATFPAVSIDYGHGSVTTLVETDATYPFTVSIANPVEFDVVLKVDVLNATATQGEDFDVPNEVSIAAGSTSATGTIEIFEDELIEDQESFTLSIGRRTMNGDSNSVQATFNILNLTSGDLAIGMSWAPSSTVTDNYGHEIGATAYADLRLLVSTSPNNTDLIGGADGGSFESWVLDSSTPDGEYYVVADFYAVEDIPNTIDLSLTFDQVGTIEGLTYDFPAALNSEESCTAAWFTLVKIIKAGDSYSFESVGEPNPLDLANFVGSWTGETSYGYETQMVTTLNMAGQLEVTGIGVGFMENDWGEVIVDMQSLVMDVDLATGDFTIAETYYMETTYNGVPQSLYYLSGTGTISGTCTPLFDLVYDFVQDGTSYTEWLGGFGWPPFEEHTTKL